MPPHKNTHRLQITPHKFVTKLPMQLSEFKNALHLLALGLGESRGHTEDFLGLVQIGAYFQVLAVFLQISCAMFFACCMMLQYIV